METGWSSRERVLAALAHEQPDRVPVDLWAEPSVWATLLPALGYKSRNEVCAALEVDIRYVEPVYPADVILAGVRQNMWGERWRKAETALGRDWQHVAGALAGANTFKELEHFPWPNCDQVDYSGLRAQCNAAEGCAVFYGTPISSSAQRWSGASNSV